VRLFSVEEARALLPEVRPVLERLRDAFVALRGNRGIEAAQRRASMADGHPIALPSPNAEEEREGHEETLRECVELLDGWGIQLKDPERGLIDFPHERDGVVVLLCYELGEAGLEYWHPVETGYAGRQRI
jgi:hypothetical protein